MSISSLNAMWTRRSIANNEKPENIRTKLITKIPVDEDIKLEEFENRIFDQYEYKHFDETVKSAISAELKELEKEGIYVHIKHGYWRKVK